MKACVVVPNWNGKDIIKPCLESLTRQSMPLTIVVVDNGSTDGSADFIRDKFPEVQLLINDKNKGFAGGVNTGLRFAIENKFKYAALLNSDAVVEEDWAVRLCRTLDKNIRAGIVTSKIIDKSAETLDSTGEFYSTWGLAFPRGRGETDQGQYDDQKAIFGASGGASLYRVKMLEQIGLFDEDFFLYYEDVDISFRAQLAGWKILFEPSAITYHAIGATSSRVAGLTTYHTLKNLPLLFWKNVPSGLLLKAFPRFVVAYFAIYFSALARGQFGPATKGLLLSILLWPKKLVQRYKIQSSRKVTASDIDSMLVHDLPPEAHKLRAVRKYLSLGRLK
jgi:GT2 family glycosyltransferase